MLNILRWLHAAVIGAVLWAIWSLAVVATNRGGLVV